VASSLAVVAATGGMLAWQQRPRGPSLEVRRVAGRPRVGARPMAEAARLYQGSWLETDGESGAEIALAGLGRVEVGPSSRVKLERVAASEQRLELERGSIHARVDAPPRLFVVDTPAAQAIDLGCEYTLAVDGLNVSHLEVTRGEVELAGAGRVSRVPAGWRCETRPRAAPGVPYAADAPEPFKRALGAWDAGGGSPALADVLARARREDAPSLWNLLSRTDGDDRKHVFTRLGALVPPPPDTTPAALKPAPLESWWSSCTSE
jgi:hypothetical protein